MIKEFWQLIKMLFSARPSDYMYKELEVVEMKNFPFKGFKSMSWCGKIIHRVGSSSVDEKTKNHEKIHVAQAMLCNDSWVRYYLAYFWEWIRHGILAPISANYYVSKFESEAYANDDDFKYCTNYDGKNIVKYKIKNAKRLYKQLGGTPNAWKQYIKTIE